MTSLARRTEDEALLRSEVQTISAERAWLFKCILPRVVESIREGLKECSNLLKTASITLPISSRETECLKGIMTRQGAQLIKGDLMIRMNKFHVRLSIPSGKHIHLQQIEDVSSLVHYSLESLEHDLYADTARRIVSDVLQNIQQGLQALSRYPINNAFPLASLDLDALRPDLPANVALDIYIQEASLVSEIRTLQPRGSDKFFANLMKNNSAETGGFVRYKGEDVRVLEHVRVESQDPALIAISAKLTALKHTVEELQKKVLATGC